MSEMMMIHEMELEPGECWACEYPERPPGNGTFFDEKCRACMIACGATIKNGCINFLPLYNNDREWVEGISILEFYERYGPNHGLRSLR